MNDHGASRYSLWQKIGLVLGLLLFLGVLLAPTPSSLTPQAQRVGAVTLLMALWWISEAVPIYATALLPLVLFPLLGVLPIKDAAPPYAEPTIFLFMGGFFLAMAMQRWGLHRRMALKIIQIVGVSPRRLILGFMVATAFVSMWVSNTATTMMIFPIGLAVVSQLDPSALTKRQGSRAGFGAALMLGIAYAASIGGVGTIMGTPPNAIFVGQAKLLFPELGEVGFLQWMLVGVPFVMLFLPLAWVYLAFVFMKDSKVVAEPTRLAQELRELGPLSRGEKGVLAIFVFAVLGWIFRADLHLGAWTIPGWATLLGVSAWVSDATVALLAALLLFVIPTDFKNGEFLLTWEWAKRIPWEVLILFGGGFCLAEGFQKTRLAEWLAGGLTGLAQVPLPILIFALALGVTLLSELASNTALAATMMPILGATATAMEIHPFLLMIPATMAASAGFMLPVATPPNAIVFGSGYLTVSQMAKAGFVLDLLGALVITIVLYLVVIPVFGL
ncbi:MAG: DASS family sodium-coupled anion symporter [Candidatus Bipolaricaulota bacterium]|nr:DASS family sodium-coupled anion symporter [Candidatus Bipolaricaulota bacterium]MCS7273827.1 DASS family sodium-coupled anion symporter [Candidatus Bipolaricaulota bacterium]MDW8110755.1 DASS family sodium-coupled anion symporter [Candidatus Bipolaricaulota bacterium]MDW8328387.1 DASS family sodium-coupled anion symporter [Candidatus Bipolaricaulota bacterium]